MRTEGEVLGGEGLQTRIPAAGAEAKPESGRADETDEDGHFGCEGTVVPQHSLQRQPLHLGTAGPAWISGRQKEPQPTLETNNSFPVWKSTFLPDENGRAQRLSGDTGLCALLSTPEMHNVTQTLPRRGSAVVTAKSTSHLWGLNTQNQRSEFLLGMN